MRFNAQIYSRKQTGKEPVTVFLQQKYLLALRLLPDAEEGTVVPIPLESLWPSMRIVIRAATPTTFGELLDRAVEAEMDEAEDPTQKESKKEEPRKTSAHPKASNSEDERQRNGPPCHYCLQFHFHRNCPIFRAERSNAQ